MALPLTLSTKPLEHPALDYAFLRREGIRILERLGGGLWTDFNAHDPGITILEQVCYAVTDLAYRINYDLKDILTVEGEYPYRSLLSPAQVLTIHPVTLTDLRKLVIDVPGVKNAWFEPVEEMHPGLMYDVPENILHWKTTVSSASSQYQPISIQGVYRVLVETDRDSNLDGVEILSNVNQRLHACRALCQDFLYPIPLQGQGIIVNADIEVGLIDNPERLLAEIYYGLASFISPDIHFHTLSEMFERGQSIDEIMNGPALQHGFLDDAELEKLNRRAGLRTSDLIQEIMKVAGAVAVNDITISAGAYTEDWYLKLDSNCAPFLNIDNSTIQLERGGIRVQVDSGRVRDIVNDLQAESGRKPLSSSETDIIPPAGRDRKIGQYHSIQRQFPAAYGIGAMGLPESASSQRKAQAKQLKAYLMFYDQLLANYFAQLAAVKDLFSFYTPQSRTYFSQVIEDSSLELDEIHGGDLAAHAARVADITNASDDPAFPGRKNRFLNHLLARFAEQFTDYSLLLYTRGQQGLIENKSAFLQEYHEIGVSRGCGFDYTQSSRKTGSTSGLEQRISRKLGIPCRRRELAKLDVNDQGGFYLVEHLLLRPNLADKQQWSRAAMGTGCQISAFMEQPVRSDPYTRQVSYVFPDYFQKLAEKGFAGLIEKTIREETPAHIQVYLHWLTGEQMLAFESAYKDWLESMIAARWWDLYDAKPDDEDEHMTRLRLRDARDRIIQILGIGIPYPLRDLKLVYPEIVAYNHLASIRLMGAQAGVLYQLCDEDGNPILEGKNKFEVEGGPGDVLLQTPAIQRDITFTVLASRDGGEEGETLETYLNQQVSIKAGIDTGLPVAFAQSTGQIASGHQIIVNYGNQIAVTVAQTQEGISYELIMGHQDAPVRISNPQKGNQKTITLNSIQGFNEDTQISVRAFRTSNESIYAILDTSLIVNVRPNPAVEVRVDTPIVDYSAGSMLRLVKPQASAEYELYRRELVPADYLPNLTAASLVIQTDEGRSIAIAAPEKISDWQDPAGFVRVGRFRAINGGAAIYVEELREDTLFIVRAAKIKNGECLQLDKAAAVLVRPARDPVVGAKNLTVKRGTPGIVTVNGTQKGVAYQLRFDKNNAPVNPPGYHITDRGIETVRLEVDLVVEEQGEAILLLPTDPITRKTAFNVLASKILTGVSAQLKVTVTLGPK